eukprot:scaffold56307_cov63-Phaeocystis_antarctica.AAC.4
MPIAECLALRLHRLAAQRLSGGEVPFVLQQRAKVADGGERALMPIAKGFTPHHQRLAIQRLGGGEVALGHQQMPTAERRACPLNRLATQRLSCGVVALDLQ